MKKYIFSIFLLIAVVCNSIAQKQTSILFIGNSLTYTNDLPQLVKAAAEENGHDVTTKMVAKPNYALMDHWADGAIQKLMRTNEYDFVVIQQGPSSQEYGRKILIDYAQKLSELCEKYDCQLAIFMAWPSRTYYHTFDGVIESHRLAAKATGSILCPVGEKWKAYFDKTQKHDYYGPDGFLSLLKGKYHGC